MGYRTHARHTICPGCREEVYLEELVGGKCPLCGISIDDIESSDETAEYDDAFERTELSWLVLQYFLFKKFSEVGANPLQVYRVLSEMDEDEEKTGYSIDADLSSIERLIPKRCSSCGRHFIFGGRKTISGDLARGGMQITFCCQRCSR